jgi:hypothetical protein
MTPSYTAFICSTIALNGASILAATRGPQRTIIVAGDEPVEQALQCSGGGNPDDCIFVLTGVPRGYRERAYWLVDTKSASWHRASKALRMPMRPKMLRYRSSAFHSAWIRSKSWGGIASDGRSIAIREARLSLSG